MVPNPFPNQRALREGKNNGKMKITDLTDHTDRDSAPAPLIYAALRRLDVSERSLRGDFPYGDEPPVPTLHKPDKLTFASPDGDSVVDDQIAAILGVSSLSYTSNDTDAQMLLPAGWSRSTIADGTIIVVRGSDNTTADGVVLDNDNNSMTIPTPLTRCLAAIKAQLIEVISYHENTSGHLQWGHAPR
jgi:hypothetical protein